jgi:transcriptional regulator with XRE-family HTH domain
MGLAVRRKVTGSALRELRLAGGWTSEDAARALGCDVSKIARVEAGERGITAGELGALLGLYDCDPVLAGRLAGIARVRGTGGWWDEFAGSLLAWQVDLAAIEAVAGRVLAYSPFDVPPLLACEARARACAEGDGTVSAARREAVARAVMARQAAALDGGRQVHVVLGERAVAGTAGGPGAAEAACAARHLVTLSGRCEQLEVRVLPGGSEGPAGGGAGAFTAWVLCEAPLTAVVQVAGPGAGLWPEPEAAGEWVSLFERIYRAALGRRESLGRLRRAGMGSGPGPGETPRPRYPLARLGWLRSRAFSRSAMQQLRRQAAGGPGPRGCAAGSGGARGRAGVVLTCGSRELRGGCQRPWRRVGVEEAGGYPLGDQGERVTVR